MTTPDRASEAHPDSLSNDDLLAVVEGRVGADRRAAVRRVLEADPALAHRLRAMVADRDALAALADTDRRVGAARLQIADRRRLVAAATDGVVAGDDEDAAAVRSIAQPSDPKAWLSTGSPEDAYALPKNRAPLAKPLGPLSFTAWRLRWASLGGVGRRVIGVAAAGTIAVFGAWALWPIADDTGSDRASSADPPRLAVGSERRRTGIDPDALESFLGDSASGRARETFTDLSGHGSREARVQADPRLAEDVWLARDAGTGRRLVLSLDEALEHARAGSLAVVVRTPALEVQRDAIRGLSGSAAAWSLADLTRSSGGAWSTPRLPGLMDVEIDQAGTDVLPFDPRQQRSDRGGLVDFVASLELHDAADPNAARDAEALRSLLRGLAAGPFVDHSTPRRGGANDAASSSGPRAGAVVELLALPTADALPSRLWNRTEDVFWWTRSGGEFTRPRYVAVPVIVVEE